MGFVEGVRREGCPTGRPGPFSLGAIYSNTCTCIKIKETDQVGRWL